MPSLTKASNFGFNFEKYTDYALNGSITGRVFSEYNGDYDSSADETSEGDYLLAYVGDELRGVGLADAVPSFLGNGYAIAMVLYSDQAAGEIMNFKYYNAETGLLVDLNETQEFIADMFLGDATDDGAFVFTTSCWPLGGGGDDSGSDDILENLDKQIK